MGQTKGQRYAPYEIFKCLKCKDEKEMLRSKKRLRKYSVCAPCRRRMPLDELGQYLNRDNLPEKDVDGPVAIMRGIRTRNCPKCRGAGVIQGHFGKTLCSACHGKGYYLPPREKWHELGIPTM